jgi:hypothetical protein
MRRAVVVIALVGLWTVSASTVPAQTFTKITSPTNPIVTDQSTGYDGATWVDYDGDGDLDLFVNQSFLYRNNGGDSFTRISTTIGSGIALATGNGNCWADYDADGDPDVFISSTQSALYRNDGGNTFTRVTGGEIGNAFANRGWSCAWGDYDADGYVDLAITHPAGFLPGGPSTNQVLRNDGPPNWTFTRIANLISMGMTSFTVGSWSDFDSDGDLDFFIGAGPANGTLQADFLYQNVLVEFGQAIFGRINTPPIGTDLQDGQLWNWIDYDNDGDLDAYLTNWRGVANGMANRLYRNDDGTFVAITTGAIVTDANTSLSSVWGDFDNDGDQDCVVANDNGQQDKYYRNEGDGTFTRLVTPISENLTHRGAAAGDYDGDGDLDLYLDGPTGARSFFRNDLNNGNHWLRVRLEGVVANRSAIGAKVRVRATIGGETVWQLREVSSQNTFNGASDRNPHFGLGAATVVDEIVVEWSTGGTDSVFDVPVDQVVDLREGDATPPPPVPDGGAVPGEPLRAARNGDDVDVTWDATSCPADAVNVYFGSLGDSTMLTGGSCDLPATGAATVALPADVWFIVVANDGDATDGSRGVDSSGVERAIGDPSAICPSIVSLAADGVCP